MPQAFSDNRRAAAEGDRQVVEPELSLGAPSLHDEPYELPLGDVLGRGREKVVGGLLLTVAPLDEEPLGVALGIDSCRRYSAEREAGGPILLGRPPPRCSGESRLLLRFAARGRAR
jgi:hypothetical protein